MKFFDKWKNKKWVSYTIATCSAVVLYVLLMHISYFGKGLSAIFSVVKPVIIGIVMAYVMDPLARAIESRLLKGTKNKQFSRKLSIILTVVIILAVIILLAIAVIPQLLTSILGLVEDNGQYTQSIEKCFEIYNKISGGKADSAAFTAAFNSLLNRISTLVSSKTGDIITTSQSVGSGLMNVVIGFILAIYFMSDKDNILSVIKKVMKIFIKEEHYDEVLNFCYRCDTILIRYIECDVIEGFIVGGCNAIFMLLCGMPYIALISVVVGVTNMAPTFGPIVGCIIGCFILALIHPWHALLFLIFTLILQTIDGYVIKPKLFGQTLGVSSLWILITIIVGGNMFGVIGILIAIPFAAIVQYVITEILFPQENIQNFIKNQQQK